MSQACWICGAEADSAEHRLKKSDLVRVHGRGPYKGPTALSHVRGGKETLVQGPGSWIVKYSPSLCQHCNSTRTQPFDRAYDQFIDWIMKNNEGIVLHRRFIDFAEIYGSDWESRQLYLYKYFSKSFGCRLVDAGANVPADVVELIGKDRFRTGLRLTVAVNEDILLMSSKDRDGFIGKGDLLSWASPHTQEVADGFTWNEHVSWLTICYWYNRFPDGSCGSTWVADSQFLYLGIIAPLDDDTRADFLKKVANRVE